MPLAVTLVPDKRAFKTHIICSFPINKPINAYCNLLFRHVPPPSAHAIAYEARNKKNKQGSWLNKWGWCKNRIRHVNNPLPVVLW